jgi:GDPmannose 4,6-dehydratase
MQRSSRRAIITGITGQDGSYLAELLLEKGYEVHGVIRRSATFNTSRIDHLYRDPHEQGTRLFLHYGDLTDGNNLSQLLQEVKPDEVYNRGAQSHVRVSFDQPIFTSDVDGLGTLRMLEAVRTFQDWSGKQVRYYQASSSEMFGKVREVPQRETTPFHPRSPYGAAKVFGHWITVNYRDAARPSSRGRSPAPPAASSWDCRSGCIWATATRSATGASRGTTSRRCG